MKKTVVVIMLLMASVLTISCDKIVSGPSDPIEPLTAYTLKFKYTRVEIKDLSMTTFIPRAYLDINGNNGPGTENAISYQAADELVFGGQFSQKRTANVYCILMADFARGDGYDQGSTLVGYLLEVEVLETRSKITFTQADVVPGSMQGFPYISVNSSMGVFVLNDKGQLSRRG